MRNDTTLKPWAKQEHIVRLQHALLVLLLIRPVGGLPQSIKLFSAPNRCSGKILDRTFVFEIALLPIVHCFELCSA